MLQQENMILSSLKGTHFEHPYASITALTELKLMDFKKVNLYVKAVSEHRFGSSFTKYASLPFKMYQILDNLSLKCMYVALSILICENKYLTYKSGKAMIILPAMKNSASILTVNQAFLKSIFAYKYVCIQKP